MALVCTEYGVLWNAQWTMSGRSGVQPSPTPMQCRWTKAAAAADLSKSPAVARPRLRVTQRRDNEA